MHACLALAFTPAALPLASSGEAASAVASNIPTRSPTSQAHEGRAARRRPAAMQQPGVTTPVQPAPAPRRAARVHAARPLAPYHHETLECPPSPPARVLRRGSIEPAMTHTLPCAFAMLQRGSARTRCHRLRRPKRPRRIAPREGWRKAGGRARVRTVKAGPHHPTSPPNASLRLPPPYLPPPITAR